MNANEWVSRVNIIKTHTHTYILVWLRVYVCVGAPELMMVVGSHGGCSYSTYIRFWTIHILFLRSCCSVHFKSYNFVNVLLNLRPVTLSTTFADSIVCENEQYSRRDSPNQIHWNSIDGKRRRQQRRQRWHSHHTSNETNFQTIQPNEW